MTFVKANFIQFPERICRVNAYTTMLALAALVASLFIPHAGAMIIGLPYTDGHMDLAVRYNDTENKLEGIWINDYATVNGVIDSTPVFAANEIHALAIFDDDTQPLTRPAGSEWDFLGMAAGEPVYLYPSGGSPPTLPYLGFSTEDPSTGGFSGNITFALESLEGPAGSKMAVFVGSNNIFIQATPLSASGQLILPVGVHNHYNISFSQPGVYNLNFSFSGTLNDNPVTGTDTFQLVVVPEPSHFALGIGLAAAGVIIGRRLMPGGGAAAAPRQP